jgi:hypothetical protein
MQSTNAEGRYRRLVTTAEPMPPVYKVPLIKGEGCGKHFLTIIYFLVTDMSMFYLLFLRECVILYIYQKYVYNLAKHQ